MLRQLNQNIHSGMFLIEYFHRILDKKSVVQFCKGLKLWEELVSQSGLKPFERFLNTIKKYQERIEIYIRSRLTTAVSEGINNKIKVLKRTGYGYSNALSFCRKILQRCGYLNHLSIDTNQFFYKWPHPA
jgi:transposase